MTKYSVAVTLCWLVSLVASWQVAGMWLWIGRIGIVLTTIPLCVSWYTLGRSHEMVSWSRFKPRNDSTTPR